MSALHQRCYSAINNNRNILAVAMLGLLHLVLVVGVEHSWVRPLLISHLGLFLLWQPLWRIEDKLGARGITFITLTFVTVIFWLNWALLAFWMGGLFGLIGGRIFSSALKWARYFYLLALFYILSMLLLWVVPQMLNLGGADELLRKLMIYFMPAFLFAMVFMPNEAEPADQEHAVDFFYGVMLMLLVAVLILGVFAIMSVGKLSFQQALLELVFIVAGVLFILVWLWNPRFGLSGLQQSFSRYLLNIGTPFEDWLTQLARHAETEPDATRFLGCATQLLAELPWLAGVAWQTPDGKGEAGKKTSHPLNFKTGDLDLQLWAVHPTPIPVMLHANLLSRLIVHFYRTKLREAEIRQMVRMQAVHDTGARLTHDLKNLLQALSNLTAAAQQPGREDGFRQLMQRQLPLLGQRLKLTLDKLKAPQPESNDEMASADLWWGNLKVRYERYGVTFCVGNIAPDVHLPAGLFDSVAENLLQNASRKQAANPAIAITVEFSAVPEAIELSVHDNGPAVEEHVAQRLFQVAVSSGNGLGIGLYQAARWASQHGYKLNLASNRNGAVCFKLKSAVER